MEKPKKQIQFNLRVTTITALKDHCKKHGYNLSEYAGLSIDKNLNFGGIDLISAINENCESVAYQSCQWIKKDEVLEIIRKLTSD
jgi:hypothetical protein